MDIAEKVLRQKQDFDDVYKAGKKAEYDAFWDMIQDYGNRTNYNTAFARWNCEYVRPKYKVIAKDGQSAGSVFSNMLELKKVEAKYFDFSQKETGANHNTGYYYTFSGCSKIEEIEDIGLVPQYSYVYSFGYCYKLHTIAKMGVDENTAYTKTFEKCEALENITIEGTIGQNGFDIRWSTKLSADSLKSIINALSTTTTGLTITLPKTAQANYEAVYGSGSWATLTATKSNWTIAYA